MISLSPLATAHPSNFQLTPVRSSIGFYPYFNLAMARSLRFRVYRTLHPFRDALFRLAFATATRLVDLLTLRNVRVTRWLIMQKARRHDAEAPLRQLVGIRFQVLFHSLNKGSFHISLAVLSSIGHKRVFSLGRWSSQIHTGFHVSRATQDTHMLLSV